MTIVWRDAMAIDHGMIDHDHHTLIDLINEFCKATLNERGMLEMQRIFERLDRYAAAHFQREEQLQCAVKYPYAEGHQREHLALFGKMEDLRRKFAALIETSGDLAIVSAAPQPELASVHRTMTELLHFWLVGHIVKSDLRMRPYASQLARYSGSFVPLANAAA
jgi:hemerythrin